MTTWGMDVVLRKVYGGRMQRLSSVRDPTKKKYMSFVRSTGRNLVLCHMPLCLQSRWDASTSRRMDVVLRKFLGG